MNDKPDDGGPAFPLGPFYYGPDGRILHHEKDQVESGMTLRDWIAGQMLAGIVSNHTMTENPNYDREGAAAEAYRLADALLSARNRKE